MPDNLRRVFTRSRCRLAAVLLVALATAPAARAVGPAKPPAKDAHPVVPGFERFFTGPKADATSAGQLLLGELNCTSCHKAGPAQEAILIRKQAPVLDGVGARVRRSFLRKFLSNPHAVKPGTAMPDLFAALPEREKAQKVEELVHFLASTGVLKHERPQRQLIAAGQQIYHDIGCVACHGTRDVIGAPARTLPTSVPLGELKAKYTLASLAAFLRNPHTTRPAGRMPRLLDDKDGKQARAVANYLLQGVSYKTPPPNIAYTYYEGSWARLPNFAKLKPRAKGKAHGFDLTLARRQNDMAMKFDGFFQVPGDGEYRFHLTSDDGSKLWLDDKVVIANDGIHPPSTVSKSVRLQKGVHKLTAAVFNAGGGVELAVDVEGPGMGRQSVAPLLTLTADGSPQPPKVVQKKDEEDFPIDPALAERGREVFASVGCASCHTLNHGGKAIATTLTPLSVNKLKGEGGCLAAMPGKGVPAYRLNEPQRKALAAGLKSLATPPRGPRPGEIIARTLTAFNCYACHQRDKVGGVEAAWDTHFTTNEREMGDEGRIPPALDGVGAKLNAAYLKKVLAAGAHDRPYMHTHMPGFGEPNTAKLAQALEAVDLLQPVPRVVFSKPLARVKMEGRKMVGSTSLGCIKCHTFAKHKAEGVQGIDMTLMPQRLRRNWFHRYVVDPQKFRPGTRMPSSWPNGVTFLTDVLGGDTTKQIEAIWVYLVDGGRPLPLGLNKHSILLVPEGEAIIYRNFLKGSGQMARAIGVGYPEKAHLAFDANDLRLAMVWQGAFLDAARHWTDRGVGFEEPLGDNVLALPPGSGFAVLDKDSEPWPKKPAKELGGKFRGYKLTRDQRPTFLYTVRGVRVEDFPNAVANKGAAPSIRRTLSLTADQPVTGLWFRAAVGDKIEATGNGWYRINGEYRMRFESAAPPVIRQSGGKTELLVPVRFRDKRARIVQDIVW